MTDADVLIVGAGPAGCAAAYDLASWGHTVCLLDHRTFPRLKPCGGALTIKAVRALRFSILPVVKQTLRDFVAGKYLDRRTTFHGKHPIVLMTVRSDLDDFVLARTLEQGAAFQKIGRITGISEDADGVSVCTVEQSFRGKFLIGADGANSTVRRLTGAPLDVQRGFAIEARVPSERAVGARAVEFDFGIVKQGYGWIFPKCDHFNVGVYTCDMQTKLTPDHLFSYLRDRLGSEECEHVVGHPIGVGGWRANRQNGRVLLVGDAAGLCEPLLGEGIYYAIRSGQLAAASIAASLRDRRRDRRRSDRFLDRLRGDVAYSRSMAVRFYADLDRGYAALTNPLVRACLMKGYAAAVPIGELRRRFYLMPFIRR